MAGESVPIPSTAAVEPSVAPNGRRRRRSVVKSSLDLVFSYSRSQQRFFAGLPSAPSFVDYKWDQEESDGDGEGDDSMREWDPEAGPSTPCESCDEAGLSEHQDDEGESVADSSAFFDDDSPVVDRRASAGLSPVAELDEMSALQHRTPLTTPGTTIPLPPKRGAIMSFFSTTPTAQPAALSTSLTSSSGSQTPRLPVRRLPETEPAPLSRSWTAQQAQQANLGVESDPPSPPAVTVRSSSGATERTPLLRPGRPPLSSHKRAWTPDRLSPSPHRRRRASATSARRNSSQHRPLPVQGNSGNRQTLFNSVAVLIGVGLLSMPLAFSYAGWICGTIMLIGFSYLTCHTAKLLGRLVIADPTLHGYTDIGRKAFGSWVGGVTNVLFCVELFAFGVAMMVLFGDSLNALMPDIPSNSFKMIGFFIILPTTFMSLNVLSVPSVLSSLATFLLVGIVLFDGFWKTKAPGSILDPMPTRFGPETKTMNWLGGIGLILAGFGGHGVMPSIARDMRNPEQLERLFNWAFVIAATVSAITGAAGYLMIGDTVSDEITRDMMNATYGYPVILNHFALWMIVLTPLTKFGLCTRPLHIAVEGYLNLAPAAAVLAQPPPRRPRAMSISAAMNSTFSAISHIGTSDYAVTDESNVDQPKTPILRIDEVSTTRESGKGMLRIISRTLITSACVITAIVLPGFEKVMAFLGSCTAFLICIIFPIAFYIRLAPTLIKPSEGAAAALAARIQFIFHIVVLIISFILMVMGTTWAFLPNTGRGLEGL